MVNILENIVQVNQFQIAYYEELHKFVLFDNSKDLNPILEKDSSEIWGFIEDLGKKVEFLEDRLKLTQSFISYFFENN